MTVALDTSALLARRLSGPWHDLVEATLRRDTAWCASALARAEALALVDRVTDDPDEQADLRRALLDDWTRLAVVPVDELCLELAGELARTQPLRIADAIHLAAADRLGRPLTYVTFDPNQIPVALALGLDVVSL